MSTTDEEISDLTLKNKTEKDDHPSEIPIR